MYTQEASPAALPAPQRSSVLGWQLTGPGTSVQGGAASCRLFRSTVRRCEQMFGSHPAPFTSAKSNRAQRRCREAGRVGLWSSSWDSLRRRPLEDPGVGDRGTGGCSWVTCTQRQYPRVRAWVGQLPRQSPQPCTRQPGCPGRPGGAAGIRVNQKGKGRAQMADP